MCRRATVVAEGDVRLVVGTIEIDAVPAPAAYRCQFVASLCLIQACVCACVRVCRRDSRWKEYGNPHATSAVPLRECRRVIVRYSKRIRLEVLSGVASIRVHRAVEAALCSAGRVADDHAEARSERCDVDACIVRGHIVDGHTAVLGCLLDE